MSKENKDTFLSLYGSDKHASDILRRRSDLYHLIARNPLISLETSQKIVDRKDDFDAAALARYTPHKEILDQLSRHPKIHVARSMMYNHNATPEHISNAYETHPSIIYNTALGSSPLMDHPNVPKHVLEAVINGKAVDADRARTRLDAGDYK